MTRSLLSTVVYVLALISFVGVQGNSINTGKKCIHGSTGYGVDGVCRQGKTSNCCLDPNFLYKNAAVPICKGDKNDLETEVGEKCGNLTCRPDEKCEYAIVKCKEGAVCPQPPPKCFPKETTSPVREKCGKKICKPNETCLIILVKCSPGSTCIAPPPKCVPKDPKPVISSDPCTNIKCQHGYTCRYFKQDCRRPGCPKNPRCVPIDRSSNTNENYTTKAQCIEDPCASVKCEFGYRCENINVTCKKAPCKPVAKCVPKNPCDKKTCKKGYECVPNKNNPTIANCVSKSCATMKCKAGYTCKMVNVQCIRAPCPPIPQCLPINPCKNKKCSEGYVCTQTKNDPTVAKCALTPCAIVRCGYNTTCMSFTEYCKYAPCTPPKAKCVPRTDENPCALVRCSKGYGCVNVPVSNCEKVSCPTTRAECKLRPKNPCHNYLCPKGYNCKVDQNKKAVCYNMKQCY